MAFRLSFGAGLAGGREFKTEIQLSAKDLFSWRMLRVRWWNAINFNSLVITPGYSSMIFTRHLQVPKIFSLNVFTILLIFCCRFGASRILLLLDTLKDRAKMFLWAHKWIRGLVLGCMVLLAGTATCCCDSYDPDPYDNVPPVVTVEFNYVVPGGVSVRPQNHNKRPFRVVSISKSQSLPLAEVSGLFESLVVSPILYGSPQGAVPLRR